ncbi:MAG TPA: sugar phosphate isomerase/epimerase [Blastocatellia bacterium]|nr:sugar phosphate isomerase/epimerase [Blastocatellia bacterium]
MNRRDFIRRAAVVAAAATVFSPHDASAKGVRWQIGCFNRPWTKWTFDQALSEIEAAGFKYTGLLTRIKEEPFIGIEATPDYLLKLKSRISSAGLISVMGALRSNHDIALVDSISEVRKQIDNASALSLQYVLSFGTDKSYEFAHYVTVMRDAAEYCREKGIRLAMKPHGGISGSSQEILRVIKEVNHRNFSIWYDAGNIVYYTGKDPVAELERVSQHVSGFCAKDCGEPNGDVMIQFGTGKVDFPAVLKRLKTAGFDGPVMIECCKVGDTPAETTASARANREFLEKIFVSL